MPIHISKIGPYEVVFTHVGEDGNVTCFASERMSRDADVNKLPIIDSPVDKEFARWAMRNRGVEQHRLDRIMLTDLLAGRHPILYCLMPNDTHLLVDGTHRYCKAAILGIVQIKARIVPEQLWRRFQVVGDKDLDPRALDSYLKNGFSGIF